MTGERTLIDASIFPRLVIREGGRVVQEVELRGDLGIGRAEDNDLQLMDPKSSRHHARLHAEGDTFVLTDLGSANGTRVNGLEVTEPHPLEHGDRITIGDTELTYQVPGRADQETVAMEGVPPAVQFAAATEVVEMPLIRLNRSRNRSKPATRWGRSHASGCVPGLSVDVRM